jgi:hypothetical protein
MERLLLSTNIAYQINRITELQKRDKEGWTFEIEAKDSDEAYD